MSTVNLTEAASLAGVSRTTLYKKIQQGKISLSKLPDGSRGIDVAELGRVFGSLERQRERKPVAPLDVHLDVHRLQAENAMLRDQVQLYKMQLEASLHERNRLLSIIEQRLLPAPVKERPKTVPKLTVRRAPKKAAVKASPPEPAKPMAKKKIVSTPKVPTKKTKSAPKPVARKKANAAKR
jgi:hypothetical protein